MSSWRDFMTITSRYPSVSRWICRIALLLVASRALRQALNESDRVAAEKRAQIGVKFQLWQNGQGSESQYVVPPKKDGGLPPV